MNIAVAIEKRGAPRHRVFKHGTLALAGGGAIDCTVRNISDTGARVDVDSPVGLPEVVTLMISADHFVRQCRRVWCNDNRIGLAFDQAGG
ncbi:PilZ domain-containing protein [Bradyrhizobium sp.]|uniref:PilZ domain-containing protein n=1 Tax=Bradyrhizobium sp. TaxID=376 RepID=UPI003F8D7E82